MGPGTGFEVKLPFEIGTKTFLSFSLSLAVFSFIWERNKRNSSKLREVNVFFIVGAEVLVACSVLVLVYLDFNLTNSS